MSHSSEERLSADLLAVAEQLSEGKHEASALDLDRIKMRAMAKARRGSQTFAPRKGRLMKRRSFLTAALVVGVLASGTGATMAVTGQFSQAQDNRPTAGAAQYQDCKDVVRNNRREERSTRSTQRSELKRLRKSNRAEERAIDDRGDRKRAKKANRRDLRDEKQENKAERKNQKAANRDEEQECREKG
jgi:hypothetical protein